MQFGVVSSDRHIQRRKASDIGNAKTLAQDLFAPSQWKTCNRPQDKPGQHGRPQGLMIAQY
eukprot:scaffold170325_cov27-Tisochrysis_lutea.AAC.6